MKMWLSSAVFAAVCVSGCATIINDKTQQVSVTTSDGQKISGTVDGTPFTTPGTVDLRRSDEAKVFETDAPGCETKTVVDNKVDGVFWLNIILGGTFGSTTDATSKEMWKYDDVVIPCKAP